MLNTEVTRHIYKRKGWPNCASHGQICPQQYNSRQHGNLGSWSVFIHWRLTSKMAPNSPVSWYSRSYKRYSICRRGLPLLEKVGEHSGFPLGLPFLDQHSEEILGYWNLRTQQPIVRSVQEGRPAFPEKPRSPANDCASELGIKFSILSQALTATLANGWARTLWSGLGLFRPTKQLPNSWALEIAQGNKCMLCGNRS